MSRVSGPLVAVIGRELQSVVGTPAGWAIAGGVGTAVVTLATLSASGGYQATAVDLVVLLEVLIPAMGAALGYRAVLHDRLRGEWAIHRAIGIAPRTYVIGLILGQTTAAGLIIGGSLSVASLVVAVRRTRPIAFIASNPAVADPAAMLWLTGLSVAYTGVVAAVVMVLSAMVRGRRDAIIGAVMLVGLLVVGLDAVAIATPTPLPVLVALSPGAAYRTLVLSVGVGLTTEAPVSAAVVGWIGWIGVATAVSIRRLRVAA
mgnify:CR=1 FL=1